MATPASQIYRLAGKIMHVGMYTPPSGRNLHAYHIIVVDKNGKAHTVIANVDDFRRQNGLDVGKETFPVGQHAQFVTNTRTPCTWSASGPRGIMLQPLLLVIAGVILYFFSRCVWMLCKALYITTADFLGLPGAPVLAISKRTYQWSSSSSSDDSTNRETTEPGDSLYSSDDSSKMEATGSPAEQSASKLELAPGVAAFVEGRFLTQEEFERQGEMETKRQLNNLYASNEFKDWKITNKERISGLLDGQCPVQPLSRSCEAENVSEESGASSVE
eukprot:jgi/Mesvir1/27263/Mv07100-RA.1